jgi:hypothetical protein
MATIPESQHTTAAAIVRWYDSKPQEHRPHMGASLIGHACERSVWLTWRWAMTPKFSGRILRLFDTGKREEARLLEELRGIGAQVWDVDPETGDQIRVSALNGHFSGSLDGIAKGLPEAPKSTAVLEFKTHSNKSFNDLVKKKVREAKPQHFDQMTVYMGLMDIDRALYIAVNKDTDDLHTEWVHLDNDRFAVLMARAERLVGMTEPPPRISDDAAYFVCKMCSFWKHCHNGLAAEANCRTCCHASPVEDAAWRCDKHSKELTHADQLAGCNTHLMIPALVPYAEPVDGGENWVAYKHKANGIHFVNGPENCADYGPVFSSKELHNCNGTLMADVISVKNEIPGSKVASGTTNGPDHTTMWDDIATHPDDIPVKADLPAKREERQKIARTVKAMESFKK